MTLDEAKKIIDKIADIPLGQLFPNEDDFSNIEKNKGRAGQLLETSILHLNLSSSLKDFENGELKTNKCDINGDPAETIAITRINNSIDDLIQNKSFAESRLAQKIFNFLYVGIFRDKDIDPHLWKFFSPIHINFADNKFDLIWQQLESDYNIICAKIKKDIESRGRISTSNGKYIQIRTKDSAPYHPIYSDIYKKYISDKSYAFYFQRDFIKAIKAII